MMQWDLFENVVEGPSIPDLQPGGKAPARLGGDRLRRSAVIVVAVAALTSSVLSSFTHVTQGAASKETVVLSSFSAPLSKRASRVVGNPDAQVDFGQGRTALQLATSFRAMLRPLRPEEDIPSDFVFG